MDEQSIRLECLKLAHTHGREAAQVVERAQAYEEYVAGAPSRTLKLPRKPTTPEKAG